MVRPRYFEHRVSTSQLEKMMNILPRIDAMIAEYRVTISAASDVVKTKRDAWRNVSTLCGGLSSMESQPALFRSVMKKLDSWADVRRSLATFHQSKYVEWDVVEFLTRLRDALQCDVCEYREEGMRQTQMVLDVLHEIKPSYNTPFPTGIMDADTMKGLMNELQDEVFMSQKRIRVIRDAMSGVGDLCELCKFLKVSCEKM